MSNEPGPISGDEFDLNQFDLDTGSLKGDQPIPGVAVLQLVKVRKSRSKAGDAMISWDFRIIEYREPASARSMACDELDTIPLFTVKTKSALWRLEQTLAALGLKEVAGRYKFSREDVLGTLVLGSIRMGSFNGTARPEIEALKAYDTPGKKMPLPETDPAAPADEFGGNGPALRDNIPF